MQCADIVPLHGQGGQWTLNRHIRDETNFVNTVPVSDMQVPGKMSIAGTSYYLASEQLQVFKKYILYIFKKSRFLVSPIVREGCRKKKLISFGLLPNPPPGPPPPGMVFLRIKKFTPIFFWKLNL